MKVEVEPEWHKVLKSQFESEWFEQLQNFLQKEYATKQVYPAHQDIFKAFNETPFNRVRLVILGQDPYHGENQAMGLSFSTPQNITNPPSLKNVFKEISDDLGKKAKAETEANGDLTAWAQQGALLLNTSLTVVAGKPASHSKIGWSELTDAAIKALSDKREGVVFMLWGQHARSKVSLIDSSKHLILEAPHPSPLSAHSGFFGCKHFSQCDAYLQSEKINW